MSKSSYSKLIVLKNISSNSFSNFELCDEYFHYYGYVYIGIVILAARDLDSWEKLTGWSMIKGDLHKTGGSCTEVENPEYFLWIRSPIT